MSGHTKGPWYIEDIGVVPGDFEILPNPRDEAYDWRFIATVHGNDSYGFEEARANAALIAASPTMYEAIRGAVDRLGRYFEGQATSTTDLHAIMESLRAAAELPL